MPSSAAAVDPWWSSAPDALPAFCELDVHVWLVALTARPTYVLSPDEIIRRDQFHRSTDRIAFATRRTALRELLARYVRRPPASLVFDRTCRHCGAEHGKPRLVDASIDFNASSRGDYAVIVVSRDMNVGIDIEHVPTASQILAEASGEAPSLCLVERWCSGEAVLKATGHGLAADPSPLLQEFRIEQHRVDDNHTCAIAARPHAFVLRGFVA